MCVRWFVNLQFCLLYTNTVPFLFGLYTSLLGPLAQIFHVPGGLLWSNIGIIFIYYTQFLLYNRVNELYTDMGREAPLSGKIVPRYPCLLCAFVVW